MGPLATVRVLCKPIQTDMKTDTDILKRYGKIETGIYLLSFQVKLITDIAKISYLFGYIFISFETDNRYVPP